MSRVSVANHTDRPWTPLQVVASNHRSQHIRHRRMHALKSHISALLSIFLLIVVIILLGMFFVSTRVDSESEDIHTDATQRQESASLVASQGRRVVLERDCFGLELRFGIRKVEAFDDCSLRVSLESPHGMLVVDYRGNGGSAVSSDILMRRSHSEKYTETEYTAGDKHYIVFQNKQSGNYEKTAFLQLPNTTVGITLRPDSAVSYDAEFQDVLNSFYCKNDCLKEAMPIEDTGVPNSSDVAPAEE